MPKYYIICVCLEHAKRGIAGGFIQSNHGKSTNIKKLRTGDGILIYSSKYRFTPENTEENKLQAFTALGYVRDELLYQGDMGGGFTPFRRNIDFIQDVNIIPIVPSPLGSQVREGREKMGVPAHVWISPDIGVRLRVHAIEDDTGIISNFSLICLNSPEAAIVAR